ncbi:MAG: sensor domain-containing phosphodiesterase [Comamonadaceae bacterium]|nr:MAG: sensor domain-containing phosphodiesterase [Comamonadaceae bacterium]
MGVPRNPQRPDPAAPSEGGRVTGSSLAGEATDAAEAVDRITRLTSQLFDVSTVWISLATTAGGESAASMPGSHLDACFGALTVDARAVLVMEDTLRHPRVSEHPLVVNEPGLRFYACAPMVDAAGRVLGRLSIADESPRAFDLRQRRQLVDLALLAAAQIAARAPLRLDDVTRLPSRGQLVSDLRALCDIAAGEHRTLVLVDVMSHAQSQAAVRAVGIAPVEAALRQIARALGALVAGHSTLYHVGESCFAFVLDEGELDAHDGFVERLLAHLRQPFTTGGVTVELELECGLVAISLDPPSVEDALRKAISAMRQAAVERRSKLWYDAVFDAPHRRAFGILRDLPLGLAAGDFRLVYQPKLDVASGRYLGAEALIRWRHPRYGNVGPGEFIPLVETSPLIHSLTDWVLNEALRQVGRWQADGLNLIVAVNVSGRNLEHPGFVRMVGDACTRHGIDPRWLHVECTESAALNGVASMAALDALRAMGIQVSLDDFGIGFSNLACLATLPIGMLKLDQSLIKPIATDPRAWRLVQSLISMGHSLEHRMLAEGVETAEVFDLLVTSGCDLIQGYYLSLPLEAPDVLPFVREATARRLALGDAPARDPAQDDLAPVPIFSPRRSLRSREAPSGA